jgi:hypothetical protein
MEVEYHWEVRFGSILCFKDEGFYTIFEGHSETRPIHSNKRLMGLDLFESFPELCYRIVLDRW